MQRARFLRHIVSSVVVLLGVAVPNGQAWGDTAATLTNLAVDRSNVSPVGLTPESVTVTAHLTSPSAIDPACGYRSSELESGGPFVDLTRTVAPVGLDVTRVPATARARLHLVGGTVSDGDWAAAVAVPSTWSGTWEVTRVFACALDETSGLNLAYLDEDPRTSGHPAAFSVSGSHVPRLSLGYSVLPRYTTLAFVATGRLVDTATGLGLAGIDLWGCRSEGCPDASYYGQYEGIHLVTDANGYYKWRTVVGDINELHLWSPHQPGATGFDWEQVSVALRLHVHPLALAAIAAKPGFAAARTGTRVTVTGHLWGPCCGQQKLVNVQIRSAATGWRTVATVLTRTNGGWTASIRVARKATLYRAFFSDVAGGWAPISGRPFLVVGT